MSSNAQISSKTAVRELVLPSGTRPTNSSKLGHAASSRGEDLLSGGITFKSPIGWIILPGGTPEMGQGRAGINSALQPSHELLGFSFETEVGGVKYLRTVETRVPAPRSRPTTVRQGNGGGYKTIMYSLTDTLNVYNNR